MTERIEMLAGSGYYVALLVGFAFPAREINAFPQSWIDLYQREALLPKDPLIQWVYANTGTVRWSDLAGADPHGILTRAAAHDLRFGVAISHLDPRGSGKRSFALCTRPDREFTPREIAEMEEELAAMHADLSPDEALSGAEREALVLVGTGLRIKEVAHQLGVSEGAVKQRLRRAKDKLGAASSAQAAERAAQLGLL
ncbi:MAG: autoinducer binding domain-containing protein [Paracoccaceae bacterium]